MSSLEDEAGTDVERANRLESLGLLAGGIVHDFNNLLSGAQLALHLALKHSDGDRELRALLETIAAALQKGSTLSEQLLGFIRGASSPEVTDVDASVREARSLVGHSMPIRMALGDAGRVAATGVEITQVIVNVLVNARDATPDGGVITVATRRRRSGDGSTDAIIEITDEGCGIAPDAQSRIFDPFYTTKPTGTGLGLATVRAIIERHGGRIGVRSAPGAGTTFEITLPALASPPPPQEGLSVLVVDNDAQVRAFIAEILTRAGHSAVTAASGFEAIARDRAAPTAFDLLITDLSMPSMNGVELSAQLPHLPVLFVSGDPAHPQVPAGSDFLAKPFSVDFLGRRVAAIAQRRRESGGRASRRGRSSRWDDFVLDEVPGHAAYCYSRDCDLAGAVADYVEAGLRRDEPALLVLTDAHRAQVDELLASRGFDIERLRAANALRSIDARAALQSLHDGDGRLSPPTAAKVVGAALESFLRARPRRRLRACGEMVDLLAEDGRFADAVWLEECWNHLAATYHFSLLCPYRHEHLDEPQRDTVRCAHTHYRDAVARAAG